MDITWINRPAEPNVDDGNTSGDLIAATTPDLGFEDTTRIRKGEATLNSRMPHTQ